MFITHVCVFFFLRIQRPPRSTRFPYTTLFRSNKKEYQARKAEQAVTQTGEQTATDPYIERATAFLDLLGGSSNIKELSSCATRLRVTVADPDKMGSDAQFKAAKAINVVHHGKAIQVIVGLDVAQVLEAMQELRKQDNKQD